MNVSLLVLGIFLFLGLVVVHELGHFWMAQKNGVVVEEFGLGFPPRAKGWKTKGGWTFSLNWLPLGGFVKLKGEHDTDSELGSMGAASVIGKTQIMVAGVVMNLLTAYILLVILALVGLPHLVPDQFTVKRDATYLERAQTAVIAENVDQGSPGQQAGIQKNDAIVAFGPLGSMQAIQAEDTLPTLTKRYAGQRVEVQFRRGDHGAVQTSVITLRSAQEVEAANRSGQHAGYLGVSVVQVQKGVTTTRSTWSAPIVAGGVMGQYTALTFQGLGKAVQGVGGILAGFVTHNTNQRIAAQEQASSQVGGPIAIFQVFKYGSMLGLRFTLLIVAILSLTLAIMNILPIPALDGGRLWLMLISRALRKPLSPQREEAINAAGFAFLMSLMVVITIVDVKRFF